MKNLFCVFSRVLRAPAIFFGMSLFGILISAGAGFSGDHRPEIKFIGNRHISAPELRKVAAFSTDSLSHSELESYGKRILELYQKKGYFFARIDSILYRGKEKHKRITLFISEGSRVRVGGIRISGNHVISTRRILNEMDTRPGQVFRPEQLRNDLDHLVTRYADRGYPLCRVRLEKLELLPNQKKVWISLVVREGPPGKIAEIRISGNKITRKKTLLRELRIWPGKAFRKSDLDKMSRRLRKFPYLRLADSVRISWDSTGNGRLQIPIREGNMAQFDGTMGYNPPTLQKKAYFTGLIDVNLQNLFGTGREFSAFWQKKNSRSQEMKLFYKEPWVLNRPVSVTLRFQQRLQDTTFIRRVWEIGSEWMWLESLQLHVRMGRESVLPDSIGEVLFRIPRSQAWRFSGGLSFDTRDDWLNPRHGLFYATSVDFLRRKTFGEGAAAQDIRRTTLDFEGYWNWFGRQVWALGLHGREVRFPGNFVPVEEQFYLGGSRTLRGYREDQFRGSRIAWSNLEYRYVMGRRSRLFLFLDTGWISAKNQTTRQWQNVWKLGYGLGIRTQTAVGIVGIDYGLGEGDAISQGKIHVRIMNQF
ncbi:MAG: BamA/TamA family outer membrane protein [Calditrichaeota bacterium]|nr:BamA/TamA family outer membrane protein [Calditrichota bacterium]